MKAINKILLLVLLLSSSLLANIATITALKGTSSINRDGVIITSTLGAKLKQKDVISTKNKTKVQMIFKDETIVTVGKNTDFSISEYLFDDKQKAVEFGIVKGTMRTITGKIGKVAPDRFRVKTKTALIGIRGTNFTVQANLDGSQKIYCTYGAISVSINKATTVVKQGFFVEATAEGQVTLKEFSADDLNDLNQEEFADSSEESESSSDDSSESSEATSTEDVGDEGQIDTTKSELATVTAPDAAEDNKDNLQIKEVVETIEDILKIDGRHPLTQTGSFIEYGITNDDEDADILLQISNGSANFAGSSIVTESDHQDELYFKFGFDETPVAYNSMEDFTAKFNTVSAGTQYLDDYDDFINDSLYTNFVIDENNNQITTMLDLSPSDDMSWGQYTIGFKYDFEGQTFSYTNQAEWVVGTPTLASVVSSYSLSSVDYTGIYRAYEGASSTVVEGKAAMNVNFLQDTAKLTITNLPVNGSLTYSMKIEYENNPSEPIKDAYLEGYTISDNSFGQASAGFAGETGDQIGGYFGLDDANDERLVEGMFQVATTDDLSAIDPISELPTESNIISSYTLSSVDYTGQYEANEGENSVRDVAYMNVNFLNGTGILTITNLPENDTLTYFMDIVHFDSTSVMAGDTLNGLGSANGRFVDTNGEVEDATGNQIVGKFDLSDGNGENLVEGVYGITTSANLSEIEPVPEIPEEATTLRDEYEMGYASSGTSSVGVTYFYANNLMGDTSVFENAGVNIVENYDYATTPDGSVNSLNWFLPLNVASTYSSLENFNTDFALPILQDHTDATTTNSAVDILTATAITGENFFETVDDISSSDMMSWGEWAIEFSYDDSGVSKNKSFEGLWVSGQPTSIDVIQAYTLSSVDYSGSYRAILNQNADNIVTGSASLNVNFLNDTGSLTINNVSTIGNLQYDMTVAGNQLSGYNSSAGTSQIGYTNGFFYGENGNSAGGTFRETSSDGLNNVVNGVYQVQTDTVLH